MRSAACFPGRLPKKAQLTVGGRVWGDGPLGASPASPEQIMELPAATRLNFSSRALQYSLHHHYVSHALKAVSEGEGETRGTTSWTRETTSCD